MPRDRKSVEAALLAKGFSLSNKHHKYFVFHTKEGQKTTIRTKTSHGGKELDDYLLLCMARQCALPKSDFLSLVDCPLSQDAYESKLAGAGKI
jgi:hypothetical protein